MRRFPALLIFMLFSFTVLKAEAPDTLSWRVSLRQSAAVGGRTPFWLVNNLQGLGSPETGGGFVRAGVAKPHSHGSRFSWSAGVDLAGAWRTQAPFRVQQLYAGIRWRSLGLLAGAKEMTGELNDPRLSSGNLLYSGNAMPIPQVRAGIPEFAPLGFTRRWLAVKGYVAYGRFTDSRWQESWAAPGSLRTADVLYHSKGVWLRGGDATRFPLQGELGIEMATQFGGRAFKEGREVRLPSGLKAWLRAFWPTRAQVDAFLGEQRSTEGNMLGTYTMALSWLPRADWSVKAYYEHFFEDQSQMTFQYGWKDGLWGLQVQLPRNRAVTQVVYEFLDTRDQTGAVNNDSSEKVPEQVSGRDNYYNHSVYSGWQHWGMALGNPLVLSPLYNSDRLLRFRANRVQGHHLGISGNPAPSLDYRVLLSWTRTWGSYAEPLPEIRTNFNWLAEAVWTPRRLRGWTFSAALAGDAGSLLRPASGLMVSVSRTGSFTF